MNNSNDLFKQQFLMHLNYVLWQNLYIAHLIIKIYKDNIWNIHMKLHEFMCSYDVKND
jgi:uncharacterized membrane protein YcfT